MKKRFECLDVFRGLAAIIVALFHYSTVGGSLKNFSIIANGHRLVEFFFVLSGFIIYYNYSYINTGKQRDGFLLKRVYRLYPLHLFMLMLFFLFEIFKVALFKHGVFNHPAFSTNTPIGFVQNLFMLQGFANNSLDFTWNYPSWSISAEMFAYLFFALFIIFINKLQEKYKTAAFLCISILILLIALIKLPYINYILVCIYCFFLGCITERLYRTISQWKISSTIYTFFEILILAIVYCGICYLNSKYNLILALLYGLLILVFASERGVISKQMTRKATIWIGSLSYSMYMTHALIAIGFRIIFLNIFKVNTVVYNFSAIIFIVILIAFSTLTYNYIEKNGRTILNVIFYKVFRFKLPVEKRINLEIEN